MACVLTQLAVDVKLSAPPSFAVHSSGAAHSGSGQQRRASTSSSAASHDSHDDERSSSSSSNNPLQQHAVTDSDDSPPASPPASDAAASKVSSSSSSSSSAASSAAGNSCHQCKTAKDASLLLFCSSAAEKGVRKRRCRKKYCESCLRRSYNPEVAIPSKQWVCPSCLGFCVCAACSRGGDGDVSKEGLSGGLATLANMSPIILHLLGIDERRLAQLQAVVNSPQLSASLLCGDGDQLQSGALMAMLGAEGAGGAAAATAAARRISCDGSLGMQLQDLSLHQHFDATQQQPVFHPSDPAFAAAASVTATLPSGPPLPAYAHEGMQFPPAPVDALVQQQQRLSSSNTCTSNVSSPYASASTYSASSSSVITSPQRNGFPNYQPPPPASPLVLPTAASAVSDSPHRSLPFVSRAHTHAPVLDGADQPPLPFDAITAQQQRLFSQPPPHPPSSASTCQSTPTPSRHLADLDAAYMMQQQQQVSRKRSYSNSLGDAISAGDGASSGSRQRFFLPSHLTAGCGDSSRHSVLDWAAVKNEAADWSSRHEQQLQQFAETELMRRLQDAAQYKPEGQLEQLASSALQHDSDAAYRHSLPHSQYEAAGPPPPVQPLEPPFSFVDPSAPLPSHGAY